MAIKFNNNNTGIGQNFGFGNIGTVGDKRAPERSIDPNKGTIQRMTQSIPGGGGMGQNQIGGQSNINIFKKEANPNGKPFDNSKYTLSSNARESALKRGDQRALQLLDGDRLQANNSDSSVDGYESINPAIFNGISAAFNSGQLSIQQATSMLEKLAARSSRDLQGNVPRGNLRNNQY